MSYVKKHISRYPSKAPKRCHKSAEINNKSNTKGARQMKINKINIPPVNPYRTNQLKAEQAKEQAKIKTDKLEISSEAKQLSETSPITTQRNERVQQLKAEIESGNYKVDAEKLASNLIKYYKK